MILSYLKNPVECPEVAGLIDKKIAQSLFSDFVFEITEQKPIREKRLTFYFSKFAVSRTEALHFLRVLGFERKRRGWIYCGCIQV